MTPERIKELRWEARGNQCIAGYAHEGNTLNECLDEIERLRLAMTVVAEMPGGNVREFLLGALEGVPQEYRDEITRLRTDNERLREIIASAKNRIRNAADGIDSAQGYLCGTLQALEGES
jgi:hypothetical protein